jgi:hypothetical protein
MDLRDDSIVEARAGVKADTVLPVTAKTCSVVIILLHRSNMNILMNFFQRLTG